MMLFHTADKQPTYAYHMVRTDAREQKLDAFVIPKGLEQPDKGSHSQAGASGSCGEMEGEAGGGGVEVMEVAGESDGAGVSSGQRKRKQEDSRLERER